MSYTDDEEFKSDDDAEPVLGDDALDEAFDDDVAVSDELEDEEEEGGGFAGLDGGSY